MRRDIKFGLDKAKNRLKIKLLLIELGSDKQVNMLQKPEPFVVKADSPWADDILDRKKVADYLTPVLASARQPFVIGLDSPYGTGKTFFLKNWQCDLEQQGFHTIYFNAWETDFSHNALFAFMAAIKRGLEQNLPKNKKDKIKSYLGDLLKKSAGFLRHRALPLGAEITMEIMGAGGIYDKIKNNWEKYVDSISLKLTEEGLKNQEAAEASMQDFKDYLQFMVKELTEGKPDQQKKLIVFVDELDRCRPNYAIQVLECIKHLFSVEGMLFILAIDEAQVRNAIHSVYGPGLDSDGYLRRFIDWRYRLPEPSTINFCQFLIDSFGLKNQNQKNYNSFDSIESFAQSLGVFAQATYLSLRTIGQCYTEANLYLRTLKEKEVPFTNALGFLLVMRLKFPTQLKKALEGGKNIDNLLSELGSIIGDIDLEQFYSPWNKLKSTLHSWFLNEHGATLLEAHIHSLASEINEINNNGMGGENSVRIRRITLEYDYEHCTQTLNFFKKTNADFRYIFSKHSLAAIVCKRLDEAAAYIQL